MKSGRWVTWPYIKAYDIESILIPLSTCHIYVGINTAQAASILTSRFWNLTDFESSPKRNGESYLYEIWYYDKKTP